jgi:hypothetical protein
LCRNSLWKHSFFSCPGWLVSDNPVGKESGCGGPGLAWLHVVYDCEAVGNTAKFSKIMLEVAYGWEINIKSSGNSSGGHSCSQHANCTLPQNLRNLWHCVVWQNCTF